MDLRLIKGLIIRPSKNLIRLVKYYSGARASKNEGLKNKRSLLRNSFLRPFQALPWVRSRENGLEKTEDP
jgi:hypothetical protein